MSSNLLYVNDNLFDYYLNSNEQETKNNISHTLGLSLGLLSYQVGIADNRVEASFNNKLSSVIRNIRNNYSIGFKRDSEMSTCKFENDFTFERTQATKLIFKTSAIKELYGLEYLVVWVSDPDPTLLSNEPFTWRGTFLYLIESVFSYGKYMSCMSGCSALQAVSNIVSGKDFLHKEPGEPLGRGNFLHPIERLQKIGAVKAGDEKRNIVSLYRNRYLTNEICHTLADGKEVRVNDLLGYPIFICEEK